jgi:hypothetical protein
MLPEPDYLVSQTAHNIRMRNFSVLIAHEHGGLSGEPLPETIANC